MRQQRYVSAALVFFACACGIPNGELSISGSSSSNGSTYSAQVVLSGPTSIVNDQCAAYTATVESSSGGTPKVQSSDLNLQINSNVNLPGVVGFSGSAAQYFADSACSTPITNSPGLVISAGSSSTTFYLMSPVGYSIFLNAGPICMGPCTGSNGIGWSPTLAIAVSLDASWPWADVALVAGSLAPRGHVDSSSSGAAVRFNEPGSVAADSSATGYLYVADTRNQVIRRISKSNGTSITFAGGGNPQNGSNDGVGTGARFNYLGGLAIENGVLYAVDDRQIRRVMLTASGATAAATVTTIVNTQDMGGYHDGAAAQAQFQSIGGIVGSPIGNAVLISDNGNDVIRLLDLGLMTVTTIAGTHGVSSVTDGAGTGAAFGSPGSLAIGTGPSGAFLAVVDEGAIRTVELSSPFEVASPGGGSVCATGGLQTIAGGGPGGSLAAVCGTTIEGVFMSGGGVFTTYSIAGSGQYGSFDGATAMTSTFTDSVGGLGIDASVTPPILYAADAEAQNIRKVAMAASTGITASTVTTLAGPSSQLQSTPTSFDGISAMDYNSGSLYVVESATSNLREVTISNGAITTIGNFPGMGAMAVLNGTTFYWENRDHAGGDAIEQNTFGTDAPNVTSAFAIGAIGGMTASAGYPLYSDSSQNAIYFAAANLSGNTLLAGIPGTSGSQDGVGGTAGGTATFHSPGAVAILGSYVYVLDVGNNELRSIYLSGSPKTVTTLAGSPGYNQSVDGLGTAAKLNLSDTSGLTSDGSRYLYFTENGNEVIRRYDTTTGEVMTIAGLFGVPLDIDGAINHALLSEPGPLVFGGGSIFFANGFNVRALEP